MGDYVSRCFPVLGQELGRKVGTDAGCPILRDGQEWSRLKTVRCFLVFVTAGLLAGCATLPNGRGWGQDATLLPSWERFRDAAVEAVLAPETWAPAAGALALQVGDLDKNLSHWASNHTPVFRSKENAGRASDYLCETTMAAYWITALATPSGEEPGPWAWAKLKGIGVGYGAVKLTSEGSFPISQPFGSHRLLAEVHGPPLETTPVEEGRQIVSVERGNPEGQVVILKKWLFPDFVATEKYRNRYFLPFRSREEIESS